MYGLHAGPYCTPERRQVAAVVSCTYVSIGTEVRACTQPVGHSSLREASTARSRFIGLPLVRLAFVIGVCT